MLAKINRLNKEKEFKKIFLKGKFFSGKNINFKIYFENYQKHPKFAIIINKKTETLATKRNKIKRQISQVLFKLIDSIKPNIKLIIIVKTPPKVFKELEDDIIKYFSKHNLFIK